MEARRPFFEAEAPAPGKEMLGLVTLSVASAASEVDSLGAVAVADGDRDIPN